MVKGLDEIVLMHDYMVLLALPQVVYPAVKIKADCQKGLLLCECVSVCGDYRLVS